MKYKTFQTLVAQWVDYLTYGRSLTFEELVEQAKRNERLRNVCVFDALTDKEKFYKLLKLSHKDPQVKQMLVDLHASLRVVGTTNHKTRGMARVLRNRPFYKKTGIVLDKKFKVTPASKDMAKFLNSLVWEVDYQSKEMSANKQNYIQQRLGQMNLVRR